MVCGMENAFQWVSLRRQNSASHGNMHQQALRTGTHGGDETKVLSVAMLQPHEKPDRPVHASVMLHAGSPEVPPQHELAPLTAHELASV